MCSAPTFTLGGGELYSHRTAEGPAARLGTGSRRRGELRAQRLPCLRSQRLRCQGNEAPRFPARSQREAAVMAEAVWSTDTGEAVYRSRDPVRNLRLR